MKRTTIVGIADETRIHPPEVFAELLVKRRLAEAALLARQHRFTDSDCPACAAHEREFAFERSGFSFHSCQVCQTLYMSPRPSAELLYEYYQQSEYCQFMQSEPYKDALAPFRKDQARKQADKLITLLQKTPCRENGIMLFGAKHDTLDTVLRADDACPVHTTAAPWLRKIDTPEQTRYGVAAAFEIFERVPDPGAELASIVNQLDAGGHMILSVRSGSGYDLLTLWQNADLSPAEHMNLFTVEGMSLLIERMGLSISELSTPGQLDLQIVKRVREEKSLKLDRFTEYFLENRNSFAGEQFQEFLQKSLLSSHMMVVGVKN